MLFRLFLILSIVVVVFQVYKPNLIAQNTDAAISLTNKQVFVPGEMVVKLRSNSKILQINELNTTYGAKIIEEIPSLGLYRLKMKASIGDAKLVYQSSEHVEYAQHNYIFASMNKDYVTMFDIEARIQQMIPLLQQRFTQTEYQKKLLRSIVTDKLLSQAAKKEGLDKSPEVKRRIRIETDKILSKAFEENIQPFHLSEDEIKAYYQSNLNKYETPAKIKGRAIIVRKKSDAEKILELLKAGADFAETARDHSIGPNSSKGGAFGWITKGGMPQNVGDKAFSLQIEALSDIIAAPPGYFIIKVEDKTPSLQKPYHKVRKQIIRHLEAVKKKDAVEKKIKELQETNNVNYNYEFLSEVKIEIDNELDFKDAESLQMLRKVIQEAIDSPF